MVAAGAIAMAVSFRGVRQAGIRVTSVQGRVVRCAWEITPAHLRALSIAALRNLLHQLHALRGRARDSGLYVCSDISPLTARGHEYEANMRCALQRATGLR